MKDSSNFFDLDAFALYEKAKRDVRAFVTNPNEDNLLNALFVLNHLREWIHPKGYDSYTNKPGNERSREEKFHCDLHSDPDYCMVRDLCNQIKHVEKQAVTKTEVMSGLIPGYARAGDRLGQRNYIADGEDVRVYMERVLEKYDAYFS